MRFDEGSDIELSTGKLHFQSSNIYQFLDQRIKTIRTKKNILRKFSDQIFSEEGPGKHNRFCLRSVDSNSLSELASMTFISPIKMRAAFGPESEASQSNKLNLTSSIQSSSEVVTPRTCPTSPLPSVFTIHQEQNTSTRLKISADMKKLLRKMGLTNEKLINLTDDKLKKLKGMSIFETKQLSLWRKRLIDDYREKDIFQLIDDFNVNQFKKTN